MKANFRNILCAAAVLLCAAACDKGLNGVTGKPVNGGGDNTTVLEPAKCTNKIVAHRGGSAECGQPDNSIASLKYAMSLKLYASECDIYWTKDNNIVVAHASSDYKINGLVVWEHTLDEIRKAGNLKNGEKVPSLEDFLKTVMVDGSCTKLCLDIKATSPAEYGQKAVQRACEIIKANKAEKFCEFICTSNSTIASTASTCQSAYGIPVGWMANSDPTAYRAKGFTWANLSAKSYMKPYGSRSIDEFVNAGMQISVFNVDKEGSTDGNAVTAASDVQTYIDNYSKLRCICTNYPKWLKNQL
ncbi:MAG: glycerophosphodiester phosphodiesterase [Bacteroidales bacterium]|nr:glycerophosphodiester phosphodiesterase [Bacteroidales bacterium]